MDLVILKINPSVQIFLSKPKTRFKETDNILLLDVLQYIESQSGRSRMVQTKLIMSGLN